MFPVSGEFPKIKGYLGSDDDVVRAWETTYLSESNVDYMLGKAQTPFEAVRRATLSQLFFKLKIDYTKYDIEQLATVKSIPVLFLDLKKPSQVEGHL